MLDLRQVEALIAVNRTGSVARAATYLGWSQPTVDYHLRKLDRLVGAQLVRRATTGSTLTPAGRLMAERGTEILALADRALDDVKDLTQTGRQRLRFGTFPTAASHFLPQIVAHAEDLELSIDITLEEFSQLVTRVNGHDLDAVLVYSVPGYDLPFRADVEAVEVFRDPLLLAVPDSHPLAVRESIDLETLTGLTDEKWVLGATADDPMDQIIVDAFRDAGHELAVGFRTDDFSVVLGMIAAGMVVGLMPRLAVGTSHPGVALVPIAEAAFTRRILLAFPVHGPVREPSPGARRMAAVIDRVLAGTEAS